MKTGHGGIMAGGDQWREIYEDERDRKLWLELSSNLKKSPVDLQALTTIQ
jgi:hypothetical protein